MEKKNLFLFLSLFGLLCLFLMIFFYFNIYLLIFILIFIGICGFIYLYSNKPVVDEEEDEDLYDEEDILEDRVQDNDSEFTLENFYVYVKDIVNLIGKSFSKNNLSYLNGFVGANLLNEFKNDLAEYNKNGYFRMISGINIRDCKLTNYYINSGYEYLEVNLTYSKIDCSVQNGVVIKGDDDNGNFLDYKYVFCRKLGEVTPNSVPNCPSCGTPASSFSNGKCLKCGMICVNEDGFYLIKID